VKEAVRNITSQCSSDEGIVEMLARGILRRRKGGPRQTAELNEKCERKLGEAKLYKRMYSFAPAFTVIIVVISVSFYFYRQSGLHCSWLIAKPEEGYNAGVSDSRILEKDIKTSLGSPFSPETSRSTSKGSKSKLARDHSSHSLCKEVDLVYTFVNGSDLWHKKQQEAYLELSDISNAESRFRDLSDEVPGASTLYHSIISASKYAPWLRHVWIVAANKDSQVPSWLSADVAAKYSVTVVPHDQIFNGTEDASYSLEEVLPTFNSCSIELHLHKIQGLAMCYLYLNDDVIFTKPTTIEDYIDTKTQKPFSFTNFQQAPVSRRGQDKWGIKLYNVGRMIQKRLRMKRKDVQLVGHHGHFFVKTIVEDIAKVFRAEFQETTLDRWRSSTSLWLPFVYSNFLFSKLKTKRKRVHALYYGLENRKGPIGVEKAFEKLVAAEKYSWLCLNDLLESGKPNYTETIEQVKASLEMLLDNRG